jgi:hypothetical protein
MLATCFQQVCNSYSDQCATRWQQVTNEIPPNVVRVGYILPTTSIPIFFHQVTNIGIIPKLFFFQSYAYKPQTQFIGFLGW